MFFDDEPALDPTEPLFICVNCGAASSVAAPAPGGWGVCCSEECYAALSEFLTEAHARPRVERDYATKDDCPF